MKGECGSHSSRSPDTATTLPCLLELLESSPERDSTPEQMVKSQRPSTRAERGSTSERVADAPGRRQLEWQVLRGGTSLGAGEWEVSFILSGCSAAFVHYHTARPLPCLRGRQNHSKSLISKIQTLVTPISGTSSQASPVTSSPSSLSLQK